MVRCIIGIGDEERRDKQDVIINIELHADLTLPAKTDRIEDAVDYHTVKKQIVDFVQQSRFHLLESLAERISGICLENAAIEEAHVRVEKPGALRFARTVGVEITRRRE
jgi:FolB domain-containing protein